tara:strand:- start:18564 stop:20093 length:1530 start_codon:yes stop_codon:yes gene_type:complete
MARNYIPDNLYGNMFVTALQRLDDIASQTIIAESQRKSQAERDYRATMSNVMMKNAPQLNWSAFGNMVENQSSFQAGARAYEDWLATSKNAEQFTPDGSLLSGNAAERLTPGVGGDPVDVSVLGVTRDDVNIVNQWITGEGDQARSMGWEGLVNQDEIDDADMYELTDMGLVRDGETWEQVKPKLVKRWQWWQSSYERNNESFKGDNAYAELERKEIESRNVAMNTLRTEDRDYALNEQVLQNLNENIQASVLQTIQMTIDDGDQKSKVPVDMYTGIILPAGALYYNEESEEIEQIEQTMPMDLSVSALNQTILANQQAGTPLSGEIATALAAMQEATSIITMEDLMAMGTTDRFGINKLQEIAKVSPAMSRAIQQLLQRQISNKMKEEQYGVTSFRSVNDLRADSREAVLAMDAIQTLNVDIGANGDNQFPGMIQAFANDMTQGTNNSVLMIQDYLYGSGDPSSPGLIYRAEQMGDAHSKWIVEYLTSLSPNGNLEEGLINHMATFGQ